MNIEMAVSASGFVSNWQAGKPLVECNLHMLQEEDSCDVTFRCGTEGHVVKAHRYMLISRSCVFHAMLTGPMAEKSDIKIPDIEPLVFKSLLKFIYTDNTDIDAENVTALLYTARKYGVTSLETKCTEFMEQNLNPDDACVILDAAHRFDQKKLYEKALTLIKSEGERSLKSPFFRALSKVPVEEIVESDDLVADEHVIFTAVNDWSEAECVREGKEVNAQSKRSVLGGMLFKIRFPIMKPAFIADTVRESGLLTDTERLFCLDFAVTQSKCVAAFNHNRRLAKETSQSVSKRRFVIGIDSWHANDAYDAISFSSSSNLFIVGCQLYGACQVTGKYTYNVTAYFGNEHNVLSCTVQERTEYTCEGEVFDVIFSRPVSVSAGEWYTLAVNIEGPSTLRGVTGQDKVVCDDGVELRYKDSIRSENGSNVNVGQIPSLIYKLRW